MPSRPALLAHYEESVRISREIESSGIVDMSGFHFIYPTTLLPIFLSTRRTKHEIAIIRSPNPNVNDYMSIVGRRHPTVGGGRSYIPVVDIPLNFRNFTPAFQIICSLAGQVGRDQEFRYMVGELTDNIYQHSEFNNALVMAQKYNTLGFLEMCIVDDGITIAGSLAKAGMIFEDSEAIVAAILGLSSKDNVERGYGLFESIEKIANQYHGEVLIISGTAAIYFKGSDIKGFKLEAQSIFSGTLISIRIPIT
jgi:hypothetical protein